MRPSRRDFLKFLLTTPLAATIDFEELLWVPKPMIVVPGGPKLANLSQIVAMELERIQPHIMALFDRDDTFYGMIKNGKVIDVAMGPMRVPYYTKPGGFRDEDD
jgi:hypothetical protein